jgi:hypothetical protein
MSTTSAFSPLKREPDKALTRGDKAVARGDRPSYELVRTLEIATVSPADAGAAVTIPTDATEPIEDMSSADVLVVGECRVCLPPART